MVADTSKNRAIARMAASAFGGKARVFVFWDENETSSVNLLISKNSPQKGLNAYSTIGLSDYPLYRNDKEFGARIELVGACGCKTSNFENAITTTAFCIINSKWFCCPGAIFPDVLSMYEVSPTMKHFFFVPPFLWQDQLCTIDFEGISVAWLMAVPISDAERKYGEVEGPDALEDLFVQKDIDIFDINRPSVL